MNPRTRRILIAVLCLEVLAYGGWLGQVWWARRLVDETLEGPFNNFRFLFFESHIKGGASNDTELMFVQYWKETPCFGSWGGSRWLPRRFYFEFFRRVTCLDLPNEPSAWEAWFKAHPNLVWDEKRKRLVDFPHAQP